MECELNSISSFRFNRLLLINFSWHCKCAHDEKKNEHGENDLEHYANRSLAYEGIVLVSGATVNRSTALRLDTIDNLSLTILMLDAIIQFVHY